MRREKNTVLYKISAIIIVFLLICVGTGDIFPKFGLAEAYDGVNSRIEEVLGEEELQKKRVYLGGNAIGFTINLNGVMISEFNEVDTEVGMAKLRSDLRVGDIIFAIDGYPVDSAEDILRLINTGSGKTSFAFSICRGNSRFNLAVSPLIERLSGRYRLGISVKEDVGGIGTLTFVRQDGRFAALGHAVGMSGCAQTSGGTVYECKIIGIEKGTRGRAGSIKGTLSKSVKLGRVEKNTPYGIYGKLDKPRGQLYDVGARETVKCGNAKLCSDISGKLEFYSIEIVKANYQDKTEEKGMVIKITDKRLLKLTGGIVQGMSGSPIIQNNRLVGAITHVFVNDPTRGYGIYLDWMLEN